MTLADVRTLRRAGRHAEALDLVVGLAAAEPENSEVQYEAACVHDVLGREAEAVPYYRAALAGDLDDAERCSAYLGLGSTLRVLGRYEDAAAVLEAGIARFPEARELRVFLAMADHNLGRSKRAVEALLSLLVETSADEGIRRYREAIRFYAQDVEKSWGK